MSGASRRIVTSRSKSRFSAVLIDSLPAYSEVVLVAPTYLAGEGIAHKSGTTGGLHRTTLVHLAAELARPAMAAQGLGPLSALGVEAIAAGGIHSGRGSPPFGYFVSVRALSARS